MLIVSVEIGHGVCADAFTSYFFPCTVPPSPVNVTATPTAGSTNVELSWEWSSSLTQCLRSVWIEYQVDGSIEKFQLNNTGITKANLPNLKCNSTYNISVRAIGMNHQTTTMGILLAPRGNSNNSVHLYCFRKSTRINASYTQQ